jgi:hypothetical protein
MCENKNILIGSGRDNFVRNCCEKKYILNHAHRARVNDPIIKAIGEQITALIASMNGFKPHLMMLLSQ